MEGTGDSVPSPFCTLCASRFKPRTAEEEKFVGAGNGTAVREVCSISTLSVKVQRCYVPNWQLKAQQQPPGVLSAAAQLPLQDTSSLLTFLLTSLPVLQIQPPRGSGRTVGAFWEEVRWLRSTLPFHTLQKPLPALRRAVIDMTHGGCPTCPALPAAAFCSLSPALGELLLLGVSPLAASRGSRGAVQPAEGKANTSPVCVRALSTVLSN